MAQQTNLIVDDEPSVLALISQALLARGYVVFAVDCPFLALALAEGTTCFDLVISDVIMPVLCGPELMRRILKVRPQIPIVFMSGDLDGEELPTGVGFLSKPFAIKDLFTVVERALASRSCEPGFRSAAMGA